MKLKKVKYSINWEIKQQHFNHFLNISNNTNMTTNNTYNKEIDFRTLNTSPLLKVEILNLEKS